MKVKVTNSYFSISKKKMLEDKVKGEISNIVGLDDYHSEQNGAEFYSSEKTKQTRKSHVRNYTSRKNNGTDLSNEEISKLWTKYDTYKHSNNGSESNGESLEKLKYDIALAYMPLVKRIAAKIIKKRPQNFRALMNRDDCITEGFFGLLKAIDRYDLNREDSSFESYATCKIWGSIMDGCRVFDNLSSNTRKEINKTEKVKREFEAETGRRPFDYEIVERVARLKISEREYDTLKRVSKESMVKNLEGIGYYFSNDGTYEYLPHKNFSNFLEDKTEINPIENAINNEQFNKMTKRVNFMISKYLSDRDAEIIRLFFTEEMSLKEIGKKIPQQFTGKIGLTESRVYQIINYKIIPRLRELLVNYPLYPYVDNDYFEDEKREETKICA